VATGLSSLGRPGQRCAHDLARELELALHVPARKRVASGLRKEGPWPRLEGLEIPGPAKGLVHCREWSGGLEFSCRPPKAMKFELRMEPFTRRLRTASSRELGAPTRGRDQGQRVSVVLELRVASRCQILCLRPAVVVGPGAEHARTRTDLPVPHRRGQERLVSDSRQLCGFPR